MSALRELSNLSNPTGDAKHRQASRLAASNANIESQPTRPYRASIEVPRPSAPLRFDADAMRANEPIYCTDLIEEITENFLTRERLAVRHFNEGTATHTSNTAQLYSYYASPHCLQYQPEVNEKMRMILIDWLIDVHLKFKLHHETVFLAVNLIDRYLSCVNTKHNPTTYVPRAQLQLVGVSAILLAAKYEEIWPPEVKECVHISANTYTREDIIKMERSICTALSFRLTVPTAYPFATRLLTVLESDANCFGPEIEPVSSTVRKERFALLRNAVGYYLEHAMLDYKCLLFTPSQVGNAAVLLALGTIRLHLDGPSAPTSGVRLWSDLLRHYSKAEIGDFRGCAAAILEFVAYVPTTKYQAVRRKYNSTRYGEIGKMLIPDRVPPY